MTLQTVAYQRKANVTLCGARRATVCRMDAWKSQREQWERLRWARLNRTPFERAKDAADSLGIKQGTYRTYEHAPGTDGGRLPPLTELQRICRKFKVSWVWVATGEGTPDTGVVTDERLATIGERLGQVPDEKQDDAIRAALGVLDAFARKAG
jgi:hypothetical protein